MTEPKRNWQLDTDKIRSLKDVRAILAGLHLQTWEGSPDWGLLKPYFTVPVEPQKLELAGESQGQ